MTVTNLNPDPDIGASCWVLASGGQRLMLDAGVHPGHDGPEGLPLLDRIAGQDLDALAISHCHHDHVGAVPVVVRQFPQAPVFLSTLSHTLIERILHNSVNVMLRQRVELGIREYPLYTHEQVEEYGSVLQPIPYRRPISWGNAPKGKARPTLEFFDAGHTLGSAGIRVTTSEGVLFYSGDVCFHDQNLLRRARFEGVKADVLILETTRGARATPPDFRREHELERLRQAMVETLDGGGSVLIPAFGLGRTQEMLTQLALWMKARRLRRMPVHIGGLGKVFTEIYDRNAHQTHRFHPELQLNEALELRVLGADQIPKLPLDRPGIYVLTAGMMTENTAAHDLAVRMLRDSRQAILFVGYSAAETPAGRLRATPPGGKVLFSPSAGEVTRGCRIEEFDLTAHATREELLEFVGTVGARVVILGHGDGPARAWFAGEIVRRFPGTKVLQPGPGETTVEL